MNDEVDVSPYLSALLRRWWIILGAALGVALLVGLLAWIRTLPYTASTFLLIVPYIPMHLHPFYREQFGTGPGMCPVAEVAYEEIISLPLFPRMTDHDVEDVVSAVRKVVEVYRR